MSEVFSHDYTTGGINMKVVAINGSPRKKEIHTSL